MIYLNAQIPSGKNQIQLSTRGGRIHKYPNKRFTTWREQAATELREQTRVNPLTILKNADVFLSVFYHPLDRRVRDVSGMLDALFHLLVYTQTLEDDGQVKGVYWSPPPLSYQPDWCVSMSLREMHDIIDDEGEHRILFPPSLTLKRVI